MYEDDLQYTPHDLTDIMNTWKHDRFFFESKPPFFVGKFATTDFLVSCIIGLSLRINVSTPIYYQERGKERSVSEPFKSYCLAILS